CLAVYMQEPRNSRGTPCPYTTLFRLIKLMDMEEIDVDEDLNVEDVDDEIDRLQEEFPELFRLKEEEEVEEKPRKRRAPKAEASDRTPPPKKKTTTEILWEGLTKGRH